MGYPNTLKFVKNTLLCVVFSTLFSVFGYPDETLSLLFDITSKMVWKKDPFQVTKVTMNKKHLLLAQNFPNSNKPETLQSSIQKQLGATSFSNFAIEWILGPHRDAIIICSIRKWLIWTFCYSPRVSFGMDRKIAKQIKTLEVSIPKHIDHTIPETIYLQKTTKSDVVSSIKLHENSPALNLQTTVKKYRAPAMCSGGHGFDSCRGLRYLFVPRSCHVE